MYKADTESMIVIVTFTLSSVVIQNVTADSNNSKNSGTTNRKTTPEPLR
jgi:hypothetical protein